MNDATDAIVMLENELDWKGAQVKELLIKLAMLLENGTSVERWMDIAMDGEVSSDGRLKRSTCSRKRRAWSNGTTIMIMSFGLRKSSERIVAPKQDW